MIVYGYIRVSTEKQTTENQKLEIKKFCKAKQLKRPVFVSETISGTKKIDKRKLGELLNKMNSDDILIVTELSRLGRSMIMIMDILQLLLDKNVKVIAIKEGYELGDNIQSKVLAFAFGLSAEIERKLISERTKQGLERVRKEGRKLGRPLGGKNKRIKLFGKVAYINREIENGRTISSLARELNVCWSTVAKVIKAKKKEE